MYFILYILFQLNVEYVFVVCHFIFYLLLFDLYILD